MSDNRKYYYLKLKENYFDEDAIVLLESMQDGILYSNILLKLYLKSLKNGGKLQLDENIPYTAQMIATITRQQVGTVERALQIFMKLGLVEPLQNGALYMSNIELLIGQSSTEGERKRRARLALQEQKALPKAGADKCPPYQADICPPEIEKEIEIEIEKERERELDTGQTARAAYGRYENVFLSQSELDGLKADLPGKWDYYIDRLGKACVLIAFELVNGVVHQRLIEYIQRYQQLKIFHIKPGHFLKKLRFQLRDDIFQTVFPVVRQVHKHRNTGGKFDELFLNQFAFGLVFLLSVRKFLFLLLRKLLALFLCLFDGFGFVDNGLNIRVQAAEALNAHQRVHSVLIGEQTFQRLVIHVYQ